MADEVLSWSEITGEPVTMDRIAHMIVTMRKLRQIKVSPPLRAVQLMIHRQATTRAVRLEFAPPDGTLPADMPDAVDLDAL